MTIFKPQPWGVSIHHGRQQTGAAVGLSVSQVLGRPLTIVEARILRKHGFVPVV